MAKWLYIVAEVAFFFIMGGIASLAGFVAGYFKMRFWIGVGIGAAVQFFLSLLALQTSIASWGIFSSLASLILTSGFIISAPIIIAIGAVLGGVGWWLGKEAKGGR